MLLTLELSAQSSVNKLSLFDDFVVSPTTAGGTFMTTTSGGTASTVDIPEAYYQGMLRLNTSTSSTGRAHIGTYTNALTAGGGQWTFEVRLDSLNALCSATEGYAILAGFFDTYTGVNQFDGVYFLYDSLGTTSGSASSDRWQTVTVDNGSPTFYETSTDVIQGDQVLSITINSDATQADFAINGEAVRSETSTIPDGRARTFGAGIMIIKSAGTTARHAYVDYLHIEHIYAQSRQ